MQAIFNRRVLTAIAFAFAAVAAATVLFAMDGVSTPVAIGFAVSIGIALVIAYQWERNSSDRSNLR